MVPRCWSRRLFLWACFLLTLASCSAASRSPDQDTARHNLVNTIQLRNLARMVLPYVHRAVNVDRSEDDAEANPPPASGSQFISRLTQHDPHRRLELKPPPERRKVDFSRKPSSEAEVRAAAEGMTGREVGDMELVPLDIGQQDFDDALDEQGEQKRLSFDDYGHMRFGRSEPVKKLDDDYGHMRFGK